MAEICNWCGEKITFFDMDFDIMTIGNNMVVVSASGTAVIIKKKE